MQTAETTSHRKALLYVVCCFLLWVFVDLGTAGGFRLSYFSEHGPLLLAFYLGYPLIFSYLIFGRHWSGWKLFLATAVAILLIAGGLMAPKELEPGGLLVAGLSQLVNRRSYDAILLRTDEAGRITG